MRTARRVPVPWHQLQPLSRLLLNASMSADSEKYTIFSATIWRVDSEPKPRPSHPVAHRPSGYASIKSLTPARYRIAPNNWQAMALLTFFSVSTLWVRNGPFVKPPFAEVSLNVLLVIALVSQSLAVCALLKYHWSLMWQPEKGVVLISEWHWLRQRSRSVQVPEDARLEVRQEEGKVDGKRYPFVAIQLVSEQQGWNIILERRPKAVKMPLTHEEYCLAVATGKDLATKLGLDLVEGGVSLLQPKVRLSDAD